MADFFFFTDIDLLSAQTNDGAFGPVVASDPIYDSSKEKYRLTSMHKATTNPLAYAICKGQVLVQADSVNSSLVNIILKPEIQPSNDLPFVKYYVYRGILKSSLTDGVNVVNGGNTLTKYIINNNAISPQKILGIELTGANYTNSDFIDNAFYLSKTGFELWTVFGGWSLGTFDKNNFGFEIITESIGYNPIFGALRNSVNVFEIIKLTGTPSSADIFDYKTKKEPVINQIDSCAFYGSFYDDSLNARKSTDSVDSNNVPAFSKIAGDNIYRDIIEGGTTTSPQNIFFNKNTVYLDIRNDLNFSFNYFENYNNSLKVSFIDDSNEPSVLIDYYSSGWPVLQLNSLPTGNSRTSVRVSFPLNLNVIPLVCVLTGKRNIHFIEKIKKGKSRFMSLEIDLSTNYTSNSLFITTSNYNNTTPISQYLKVKFIDQTIDGFVAPPNSFTPIKADVLDFIFSPIELSVPFINSDPIKINVFNEDTYINLINDFGIDYTSKIGVATDANNTALFWAISKRNTKPRFKAQSPSFSLTKSTDAVNTVFTKYLDLKINPDNLTSDDITISGNPIQLIKEVQKKLNFFNKRNSINFNTEFFSIILSNSDFLIIKNLAQSNFTDIYKPYLCIKNKTNGIDDGGASFLSYEFVLKGLKRNGSNNIEINEVLTGVIVYSYPFSDLNN